MELCILGCKLWMKLFKLLLLRWCLKALNLTYFLKFDQMPNNFFSTYSYSNNTTWCQGPFQLSFYLDFKKKKKIYKNQLGLKPVTCLLSKLQHYWLYKSQNRFETGHIARVGSNSKPHIFSANLSEPRVITFTNHTNTGKA